MSRDIETNAKSKFSFSDFKNKQILLGYTTNDVEALIQNEKLFDYYDVTWSLNNPNDNIMEANDMVFYNNKNVVIAFWDNENEVLYY